MTAVRGDLQPTLFELSHAGRGGGKIPHPPADALDRIPAAARRATPPALPELSEPEVVRHYVNLSHLNYSVDSGFYPLGSCTMKFNPEAQRVGGAPAGLRGPPPDGARRGRAGDARAAVRPRGDARRDQRHGRGHPPAGRGRTRRADRDHDDPRLPPVPRRRRAPGGPRPGLLPWHQPGDRDHGRLPHDHHPVRAGRRRGHRRVQGGAWPADRGDHDHQPLHARPVRAPDRGAAGRHPRGGRAGLHGRREPERDPRAVQARRGRLRRHALQHPQDVQHAARRRWPGRRSRRREGPPRAVPARSAGRPRGRRRLPPRDARRAAHLDRPDAQLRRQQRGPRARVRVHPGARGLGAARGQRRRGPRRELPEAPGGRGVRHPVRPCLQARVRRLRGAR